MEAHKAALATMIEKVKDFYHRGISFRVYHGGTASTRISNKNLAEVLDTSSLCHVLSVDTSRQVALVEPNVPMDILVATTLAKGFIPEVVPEFPGITVGGSFAGTAAESSSFRYGFFDRSVNWVEMVLANGDVVKATANHNTDLLNGSAGACGTLAISTLFEVRLVKAKRFVQVEYVPVYSAEEALKLLDKHSIDPTISDISFLDAIMFSPASGVVVLGSLVDETSPELPIVRFSRAEDPWFYLHAHESTPHARHTYCDTCTYAVSRDPSLAAISPVVELVPTADYLFRYDRGAFWLGTYGNPPWLFTRVFRYLFDNLFRTRTMYKTLHHSGRSQCFIVQDLALPRQSAPEFLAWADDKLQIYPLWLCPIAGATQAPLHLANRPAETKSILNVGLWGVNTAAWPRLDVQDVGPTGYEGFKADNRAIEARVRELGGLKWLYAHNYYTEVEFWTIYDKAEYDRLRKKWGATSFPSLWEKVRNIETGFVEKAPIWKALLFTILGKDHLLNG